MKTSKSILAAIATASCAAFASATPVVSNVSMSQDLSRRVTISYTLSEQAVVTLDIQTNDTQGVWVSIGGEAISGHVSGKTSGPAQGDVWKVVSAGSHTITWRPDYMWPDHVIGDGGARAVVTAWALDNPPDYMVADLSDAGGTRYYPDADFLPGGLLANEDYRKTKFVLRKIMAKDIEWTKGGNSTEPGWSVIFAIPGEPQYTAQIDNNYYIGVFEVTQTQWEMVTGSNPSAFKNADYQAMRPVDQVSYNAIRGSGVNYPAAPSDTSFLGKLRTKFGNAYAFDLPSEAQWEFASRAGHGLGLWNDGSRILATTTEDANLSRMARYLQNGGHVKDGSTYTAPTVATCTADNGTAICGSYAPNDWGLYDMEGNMLEWCLDWFTTNESTLRTLKGAVNTTQDSNYGRVMKGGSWTHDPWRSRPGFRWHGAADAGYNTFGFRLSLGL
ncbi:MAG: formylglycine-generating enzyme family protein [Kiritimatiellae bacterium]|nr:formylglycine-generating enzyme family protein [Kiritimatiellia bacterium]